MDHAHINMYTYIDLYTYTQTTKIFIHKCICGYNI